MFGPQSGVGSGRDVSKRTQPFGENTRQPDVFGHASLAADETINHCVCWKHQSRKGADVRQHVDCRYGWLTAAALVVLTCAAGPAASAEPAQDLLSRLPSGALATAEMTGLDVALQNIQDSEVLQFVLTSELYQRFVKSPRYQQVQTGRNFAEAFLGMSLWDVGQKLLGHRVALGLYAQPDGKPPAVVGVVQASDADVLAEFRQRMQPFLSDVVTEKPSTSGEQSVRIFSVNNQAFVAFHQDWVAGSNDRHLLVKSLKRLAAQDPPADKLTKMPAYQTMLRDLGREHFIQAFVNLQQVREAYQVAIPRKLDNPVASLLFGGLFELAATSDYLGVSVDQDKHGFRMRWGVAGGPETVPESHQSFFSDPQTSGTAAVPELEGLIGGITLYRDFSRWYRSREHLIEETLLPEFDKFEAGLGNILPGRDFGEDVLPLLGSQISIVAAPQTYEHLDGKPGVQLPGFGLIIDLEDPAAGGDLLALFFQTLTAILNIEAGQQGRQPWIVTSESYKGTQIAFARYLKRPAGERLPIVFNFTPSSARIGRRFVICTSRDLCRSIVDQLQTPTDAPAMQENRNFSFELRGTAVALALRVNRQLLTARSVKSGKTLEQAQRELEWIMELIQRVQRLRLSTHVSPQAFQLELEARWR